MGHDKARLPFGGAPLLVRLLEVGREACEEGILVTDVPGRYDDLADRIPGGWNLRTAVDRRPGLGPLAGLEAGLGEASSRACFVASCDLPRLEAPLVRSMLEALGEVGGDGPPAALVPLRAGRDQPLCAAYERRAHAVAAACLDRGELRVEAFLERLRVRRVDEDEVARRAGLVRPAAWTADVDTPADLEAVRRDADRP